MLENFKAYQLAKSHYRLCKRLKVQAFLYDQLVRASSSVVLNLAEGSAKRTSPDQKRFYAMAFGSLRECRAILDIEDINDEELVRLNSELGAILFVLSKPHRLKAQTQT